jgi:non-heme chloroperoxidase
VPIAASALATAKFIKNATLKIYPNGPHGLADSHKQQLNIDLLGFINA